MWSVVSPEAVSLGRRANLVLYDQHIAQNSFETEAGPVMVENFCSWFAMKVIPLVTG
jgi:hypothetical protein